MDLKKLQTIVSCLRIMSNRAVTQYNHHQYEARPRVHIELITAKCTLHIKLLSSGELFSAYRDYIQYTSNYVQQLCIALIELCIINELYMVGY